MSTGAKVIAGLIAALVLAVVVQSWRLSRAHAEQTATALALTNEQAQHDTTRAVDARTLAAVRKLYGDSLAAVTRLLEQRQQPRDAVSKANGTARIGTVTLGVGGAETHTVTSGTVAHTTPAPDTTTRVASFDVRAEPFTSHAVTTIPATGTPSLDLTTRLDRAQLTARLECGAPVHGVRPASILVVGPPWLSSTVEQGQLEPRLCNPDLGKRDRRFSLGVTAGYGATLHNGQISTGPSVTVGVQWRIF